MTRFITALAQGAFSFLSRGFVSSLALRVFGCEPPWPRREAQSEAAKSGRGQPLLWVPRESPELSLYPRAGPSRQQRGPLFAPSEGKLKERDNRETAAPRALRPLLRREPKAHRDSQKIASKSTALIFIHHQHASFIHSLQLLRIILSLLSFSLPHSVWLRVLFF